MSIKGAVTRSVAGAVVAAVTDWDPPNSGGGITPPDVLATAIVDLNEDGIVVDGDGYVTNWENAGTGGTDYALDVVGGTLSDSSVVELNGRSGVANAGNYYLEPTTGQLIEGPTTVFLVGRDSQGSVTVPHYFFDAKSNSSARFINYVVTPGTFRIYQGTGSISAGAFDQDPHVMTAEYLGTAASNYSVTGVGSAVGDIGAHDWDYMTLFASLTGGGNLVGEVYRVIVFSGALSSSDRAEMISFLRATFGLPA